MWQIFCTHKRCDTTATCRIVECAWSGATRWAQILQHQCHMPSMLSWYHTAQFWDQQSASPSTPQWTLCTAQWNVWECWDRLYPLQLHQMEQLSALLLPSATEVSPFDGESLNIWISICAWFQTNLHLCSWVVSWRRTVTALGFLDFCDFSDTSLNWLSTFTNCTNNLLSDKRTLRPNLKTLSQRMRQSSDVAIEGSSPWWHLSVFTHAHDDCDDDCAHEDFFLKMTTIMIMYFLLRLRCP